MQYKDPAARELFYLLRDFEYKRSFEHIKELLEHAAEQTGRSATSLARDVLFHGIAPDLETPSPAAWRSASISTRLRLAGSILYHGRILTSWYKRHLPFTIEDRRHQNPGRPRKTVAA